MVPVNDVQISTASPIANRRRRIAQQQSRCCGCALALACLVLGAVALWTPLKNWRASRLEFQQARERNASQFPLDVETDERVYHRHSLVKMTLRLIDKSGYPVYTENPPQLFVRRGEEPVETIGGMEQLVPQPGLTPGEYILSWPVPWNAPTGEYTVSARVRIPVAADWPWMTAEEELVARRKAERDGTELPGIGGDAFCVASTTFLVEPRKPPPLTKGMCAATWEEDLPWPGMTLHRPTGKSADWRAIFDWCEFIGADSLWVRGALTRSSSPAATLETPFVTSNLAKIPQLAAEAHRHGLKFGAWAIAFNSLPETSNSGKPPYEYASDISRSTGQVSHNSFISFRDQRRQDHLATFLKAMQDEQHVDHVGLDYMRTEPGYELADAFAREMPVPLPKNWSDMSREQRWTYVARRTEPPGCYEHPEFYEAWNWYRAHRGAQIIETIIEKSQLKKPLWIFTLSWKHGVQHGQDPIMFSDAGASMIAPMLYQVGSREHYEFILKDWNGYIKPNQVNLVCGDQVDNYWHQNQGPVELYRRMVEAHQQFVNGGRTMGAFWHDISRAALVGNLGPFSPTEWGLAGGAAFSRLRDTWRCYPLTAGLEAPATAGVSSAFEARVKLENLSERSVRQIRIQPVSTPGIKYADASTRTIQELGARQTLTVPFRAQITGTNAERKNRFMLGFRITWPEAQYGEEYDNDLPRVIILITDQYITVK